MSTNNKDHNTTISLAHTQMIFQKFGNIKFAYRNREFWCKGYYIDTVGKNTKAMQEYIANQIEANKKMDQLALFDPKAPFSKR